MPDHKVKISISRDRKTLVAYLERFSRSNPRCALRTIRHHRDGELVSVVDVTKVEEDAAKGLRREESQCSD
jgi:predicted SnoaL-like aldol condensation-catalyzing enzyme